jgi:REP element-mobilizing transposase RayT
MNQLICMAVRMEQQTGGIYFTTFTCFKWKPLFEIASAYDSVYNWFDHLNDKGSSIIGYVIMPNHLHSLINFLPSRQNLNTVIGNAKRFLAYDIIKRLEDAKKEDLLQDLYQSVKQRERKKGQRHKVFEESFDAKQCVTMEFIEQKLNYIHHNPVKGKWNLADDFTKYPHSSAGFYFGTGANAYKKILRLEEVKEVDFSRIAR